MRAFVLPLALFAALGLPACGPDDASPPDVVRADTSLAASRAPAPYSDATFLREMTAHHQMAVEMAGLAADSDAPAPLKAMAAKMDADQTREIAEMRQMLARLDGAASDTTAPGAESHGAMGHGATSHDAMDHGAMDHGAMDHRKMGMPMSMGDLRAAEPFDRAFLVGMIGHHAAAITMSADALHHSRDAEVQRLAGAIVRAQTGEIAQMQRMLDALPAPTPADSARGGADSARAAARLR